MLKELGKLRGRHTELVSFYVPADYNLVDAINQLRAEQSTASNIKSKTTRKNVLAALEKIIQHLRTFRKTPKNGLVVFCGNVSKIEGREDIRLWSVEPPEPMKTKIYWCNQAFVLEPLVDLVKEKEVYGLIVLDAREATIGLVKGKRVETLKRMHSTVPSKTVKGGMSQARYDRLREDAINEFLTKVGEKASELFLQQENLRGVLVGGPGPIKERLAKEDYLNYQIREKLLGVKDIGYTNEYGLEELIRKSEDLIKRSTLMKEKNLVSKFFSLLQRGGNVVYGLEKVLRGLEYGAVERLLISESFDLVKASLVCSAGHETEVIVAERELSQFRCKVCGNEVEVKASKELTEELEARAKAIGAKVEYISTETQEGKQFLALGGIGAFLRFKI